MLKCLVQSRDYTKHFNRGFFNVCFDLWSNGLVQRAMVFQIIFYELIKLQKLVG